MREDEYEAYKDLPDCHGDEVMPVPKLPPAGRDESVHDEPYEGGGGGEAPP